MATSERVPDDRGSESSVGLVRALGPWDGALITIGAVVGTGIFLTTSDMARALPHPGLILLVWLVGGLLSLAGALTYAELGVLFPRAGGIYDFLKEAYGPLWGFLYGWASFFVIMSGGIAALSVGFGEYLGSFFPFLSTSHVLVSAPIGPWRWTLNGGQLAGVGAILVLTVVNQFGVKEGAWVQNGLTVLKLGGIAVFLVAALAWPSPLPVASGAMPPHALTGFGVAMIAALWTYDGWYGLTFSAGEMKNPGRNLPLGIILGTAGVAALYVLVNVVYVRTLSIEEIASHPRVAEAVAAALMGPTGARLLSAVVVISTFGCVSSTILYSSRIYQPMAVDGVFFRVAGGDPSSLPHARAEPLGPKRLGHGADRLRNLRTALHLCGLRRPSLPRGHGRGRVRLASHAPGRAPALSRLGLSRRTHAVHPVVAPPRPEHPLREAARVDARPDPRRAGRARVPVLAPPARLDIFLLTHARPGFSGVSANPRSHRRLWLASTLL